MECGPAISVKALLASVLAYGKSHVILFSTIVIQRSIVSLEIEIPSAISRFSLLLSAVFLFFSVKSFLRRRRRQKSSIFYWRARKFLFNFIGRRR